MLCRVMVHLGSLQGQFEISMLCTKRSVDALIFAPFRPEKSHSTVVHTTIAPLQHNFSASPYAKTVTSLAVDNASRCAKFPAFDLSNLNDLLQADAGEG